LIDASFDLIASSESGDELGDELSASRGWTARRALEGALEGATVVRPPLVRNEGKEPRSKSMLLPPVRAGYPQTPVIDIVGGGQLQDTYLYT
tara:strand:+ start:267 stop:542 length:276 start_codon:yes stop_codon:yes gene_type:complete